MDAGKIFVLALTLGFITFIVYLAVLSRRAQRRGDPKGEDPNKGSRRSG
jgi:hypothetical protein